MHVMEENLANQLTFDGAAVYRISVHGGIPARWCDALMGLAVQHPSPASGAEITLLEGELPDQAALIGVLVALYEMQLPVLAVEYLGAEARQP
jgi:hypothetical protein